MSSVSGIILTYSPVERVTHGDGFPLKQLRSWLYERELDPLISVQGCTASWYPGCDILIGGYNHFDEEAFSALIQELDWTCPENVVLLIEPDEGPTRVIRPPGRNPE